MVAYISAEKYLSLKKVQGNRVELPAPSIDEAVDGVISADALQQGLTLRVPDTELPDKTADVIALGYKEMKFYNTRSQNGQFPPIHMPANEALQLKGERIELHYSFNGVVRSESSFYDFAVKLHEVQVPAADGYIIPWSATATRLELIVLPYDEMKAEDTVSVYLIGERGVGGFVRHIEVESHDVGQPLCVVVDGDVARLAGNTHVHIWYTVSNAGLERKGPAATYQVRGDVVLEVARSNDNELMSGEFRVLPAQKQVLTMLPPLQMTQGARQVIFAIPKNRYSIGFNYDMQARVYDGQVPFEVAYPQQEIDWGLHVYSFSELVDGSIVSAPFTRFIGV